MLMFFLCGNNVAMMHAPAVFAVLLSTIQALFSGFLVPSGDIPPYWRFLYVSAGQGRAVYVYVYE